MFLRNVPPLPRINPLGKLTSPFYENGKTIYLGFCVTSAGFNHMRVLKLHKDLELFIAGIAAVQSLFMAAYSFLERKRDFKNALLGLFFVAIAVRITKSMLWVYLDSSPLWFLNLGFAAHAISGPALLLYVWHHLFDGRWSNWNFLHFLPGLALLLSLINLPIENFWHSGGYIALLCHQLGYSVGTLSLLGAYFYWTKIKLSKVSIIWLSSLVVGTALLQILYFSNYILGITPYLLGPISYLPFVCFMAFFLFKNPSVLNGTASTRHQNIRLSQQELHQMALKIRQTMESQKLFLDSNCSLDSVAKATKIQTYLVSHVVNNSIGSSFPDFLNRYRIEEAKQRLSLPKYRHNKVASIAYDCGFNSLSSFNLAFKKMTGTTPTKFQLHQTTT